jgi:hypothetical protein
MRLLTLCLLAIFTPSFANAQMICGSRTEIVASLTAGHQETKTAQGLSGNGALVELFTGPKGSWTLLLTTPSGQSCLIGAGDNWEPWKEVTKQESY